MKRAPERSAAARAIACFSCCLLLCFPSHAQDMPSPLDLMGTDFLSYVPIPADRLASYLLDGNELVADGEFFGFPQPTREELRANKAEQVRIHFQIHKLYKGPAAGSIKIELTSDMLVFPGTKVSRYVTSALIQDRLRADLDPLHKQVDALKRSFEAKEIDRTKFDLEMNRLTAAMNRRIEKDAIQPGRMSFLSHGWTFYDEGGVIRPGQRFLIGANRVQTGREVYGLGVTGDNSTVYWGETRDYVLSGFEASSPTVAPD